jgi:hypothetical protein
MVRRSIIGVILCIVGVILGAIAGGAFNMAIIKLSSMIFPLPEGATITDSEAIKTWVQSLPLPAFLLILLAHAGGALVGGFVAALIARRAHVILGAIIGGLFLLGGIANVISIPAPIWFVVADLVLYLPAGILGAKLAPRRTAVSPT